MDDPKSVFELFLGILIVIFLAYLSTVILGKRARNFDKSKYMKIIDKIMVGKNQTLCVVQIGKRYLLIGITPNNIECLAELDEESLIPVEESMETPIQNIFNKYIGNFGKSKKRIDLININNNYCKDSHDEDKDIENE